MLSTHAEEVLRFIRDFEIASRDYLLSKGLSQNEMTNAYLDLQWDFLHTILKRRVENHQSSSKRHLLKPHKRAI